MDVGNKEEKKLKNIENGIVIDHIYGGWGLTILKILGIKDGTKEKISVITNVKSKKLGLKDIVKLENININPRQLDVIAVIAPQATINLIKNFEVVDKHKVKLPRMIEGIFECLNPTCATHTNPVTSKFLPVNHRINRDERRSAAPLMVKCYYCEREWSIHELVSSITIDSRLLEMIERKIITRKRLK